MAERSDSRREFLWGAGAALLAPLPESDPGPHLAMGARVGEVTPGGAVIWTRLTRSARRNDSGRVIPGRAQDYRGRALPEVTGSPDDLEGACPGMAGRVRIRYGQGVTLSGERVTPWAAVDQASDYIHQFKLTDLTPNTTYHYVVEATPRENPTSRFTGNFRTAPGPMAPTELTFCVMTCQGYPDRGHVDGHDIYPAMLALNPSFACLTGDLVYYDNDMPRATSVGLARYHWQRMFSLPRLVEFQRRVGCYWLKDDHDTLDNDSWPGRKMGDFNFAEGQRIFRQQAPLLDGPAYRTFRWGRDLQIWLTDGRDARSPNTQPDGPNKTIWGREQKEWFKRTVRESDATWKILVSPTPLVGPDRPNGKNDNHSNLGFKHEGDELRHWLRETVPDNFFVICGDRHWQYHSVHPDTGLHEFSVGPASNEHAGGSPGENRLIHRFHRVRGGFLTVRLEPRDDNSELTFHLRDVHGTVGYQARYQRKLRG